MFTFNTLAAINAQKKYCEEKHLPYFAPKDGRCWRCGKNIYSINGISVEQATNNLITGCPFCNYSYCE